MARRRTEGNETWSRLSMWTKGQAPAERLSAHVLRTDGFTAVDPSHPLGGKDGLKDVVCERTGKKWIGAAYFPRGQQPYVDIRKKFVKDLKGVAKNRVEGMAFVTNQELTLSERKDLRRLAGGLDIDVFHLERISSILDSPTCYGIRLEYLDIEMSKEEQLALLAERDGLIREVKSNTERIIDILENHDKFSFEDKGQALKILRAIRFLLGNFSRNNITYRSLIEGFYETLDKAIPVLIESKTFSEFIETSTGSKPHIREFPEEWKPDWNVYVRSSTAIAFQESGERYRDHMKYGISRDRHLELNEIAMNTFSSVHDLLVAAINDSD